MPRPASAKLSNLDCDGRRTAGPARLTWVAFLLARGQILGLKFLAFVQNEEFIVLAFDPLQRNANKAKAVLVYVCREKKKTNTRK